MLASIYFVALFTVCVPTFKKGYVILGILGIFLPFLWLIGAVLPDRRAPFAPPAVCKQDRRTASSSISLMARKDRSHERSD